MRDRKIDRHSIDKDTITIWVPRTLKDRLKREAKEARLPSWGVSKHILYELLASRGLWAEPYRPFSSPVQPIQQAPNKKSRD